MIKEANIRKMTADDRSAVLDMMHTFYSSPAVHTNGSVEIFVRDIDAAIDDNPYLEGYIIESDGASAGYAMLSRSFSTEFGKPCIWIEDIYIKDGFRGKGLGQSFVSFVINEYSDCIVRLEVEEDNKSAVHVYKKAGFKALPYSEMVWMLDPPEELIQ